MTQKNKRIFIINQTLALGSGGMERTSVELANELVSRGWDVALSYFYKTSNDEISYDVDENISHIKLEKVEIAKADFMPDIEKFNPDVILVFYTDRTIRKLMKNILQAGVPIVLHQGSNPKRIIENNWVNNKTPLPKAIWENEIVASTASRVRVTLPSYKNFFPKYLQNHVVAFGNATRPAEENFEALRNDNERRKRIINIGGLKLNKNVFPAVEAFANIAEDFPDWDFVIFSDKSRAELLDDVNSIIKEHSLEKRILIKEPTNEIYSEYAKSDIHLIASLSEGHPNCVAEAMCNSLPSIGLQSCPGTNELIEHEKNGLLAPEELEQKEGLEICMRKLMEDDSLRNKLGQQALKDSKKFDPKEIYDKWESLLNDAISSSREKITKQRIAANKYDAQHSLRAVNQVFDDDYQMEGW